EGGARKRRSAVRDALPTAESDQSSPLRPRKERATPKTRRIALITARLWSVSQPRIRPSSASDRPGANVPKVATPTTDDEPSTTKSTPSATVWAVVTSALTISPAAAMTSGYVAE